jgi:hypothetical protein
MKSQDLYRKNYAIKYRKLLPYRNLVIKIRKIISMLLLNIFYIFSLTLYYLESQKINIDKYFNLFIIFFIIIGLIFFFKMDHFFAKKLAFKSKKLFIKTIIYK